MNADAAHLAERLGKVRARLKYWEARCHTPSRGERPRPYLAARKLVRRLEAEETLIMRQLDLIAEAKDGD